jgi:16S rRNA (guanine527-N7)-methyltransferase
VTLSLLTAGASALGIALDSDQIATFERYVSLLLVANQRLNLTRIVEHDDVQRRHLLDALTCALPCLGALRAGADWRCIDVGSGGGVPGIPLAIAFPSLRMTLLESVGKKAAFLREAIDDLGLAQIAVRAERAEDAARAPSERDGYDLVVARALAPLDVALELCLPFARAGAVAILPRGSDLDAQLASGEVAAGLLSACLRPPIPLDAPGLPPGRRLIVADKLGPTPARFPRRAGMAAKRSLTSSKQTSRQQMILE